MSEENKRKIQIKVDRSPEIEALRKELMEEKEKTERIGEELSEKKALIEQRALETFEKEKQEVLDLVSTQEQKEFVEANLQSPSDLEKMKAMVSLLTSENPKPNRKIPSGKPIYKPQEGEKQYDNVREMIDDLYNKAYEDKNATRAEKEEAERKINKLWKTFIGSKSWLSLRKGRGRYPLGEIIACPYCGKTYYEDLPVTCEKRGADLSKVS